MAAVEVVEVVSLVMCRAPTIVENFRALVDELPKLLNSLNVLCKSIGSTIDDILSSFNAMKRAGIKLESKSRTVFHDLSSTSENALLFVDVVNNLLWYGQEEAIIKEVQDGIESNNFGPLEEYISTLKQQLVQVGTTYQIFTASCKEVSKSSVDAAETCKCYAVQQRSRRKAAKVVGTAATTMIGAGGGIATLGIILSGVVAPVTAGVGGAVGIGITATAVGATTAGGAVLTAIATHLIATDFKNLEKEFQDLGAVFNGLANEADSMNEIVETLHLKVTLISSCLDSVEHCWKKQETVTCLKASLNLLYIRFGELHEHSSACYENVQCKQVEIKSCFETMCLNRHNVK